MPIEIVTISPDQMEVYRATARRRQQEELEAKDCRRELAWKVARRAAGLLREEFGASRVVIFGSLDETQASQVADFLQFQLQDLSGRVVQPRHGQGSARQLDARDRPCGLGFAT